MVRPLAVVICSRSAADVVGDGVDLDRAAGPVLPGEVVAVLGHEAVVDRGRRRAEGGDAVPVGAAAPVASTAPMTHTDGGNAWS